MGSPSPTLPSHSQPSSSSLNMFLVFLLSLSVASVASQCVLTPSTENVVSTQLVGNWTLDKDLTTRIWPSVMDRIPTDQELIQIFVDNPEVLDLLPNDDCLWFKDLPIYMAGLYSYNFPNGGRTVEDWETSPFILTVLDGNPHLVYWWKEMTDTESFNVMMARAEDESEDMLLMGGDFNNQPFTAWRRM